MSNDSLQIIIPILLGLYGLVMFVLGYKIRGGR